MAVALEDLKSRIEQATAAEIERYYRKAKEILSANMDFPLMPWRMACLKGILTMYDIADIRNLQHRVGADANRTVGKRKPLSRSLRGLGPLASGQFCSNKR